MREIGSVTLLRVSCGSLRGSWSRMLQCDAMAQRMRSRAQVEICQSFVTVLTCTYVARAWNGERTADARASTRPKSDPKPYRWALGWSV